MIRKTTLAAAAITLLLLILAVTKDQWLPPSWNRDWHNAWMVSPQSGADPREAILEDHRERVEAIETDYRERIEEQKELNARLQERLGELQRSKQES
ncbi:MAG: hypothetical protein KC917_13835 [Candidatus Omnitrophica bacterium]|nr:hypothetical protein [Candidatus Omnitrophota bacterium]